MLVIILDDQKDVTVNGIKYNLNTPRLIPCTELYAYSTDVKNSQSTLCISNVTITENISIGRVKNLKLSNVTYAADSLENLLIDTYAILSSFEIEGYFDASKVSNFDYTFAFLVLANTLDLRNCIVDNVTTLDYCFSENSRSLMYIDISTWNLSKVESMTNIFENSTKISTLNLGTYFGKMKDSVGAVDFSSLSNWTDNSVKTLTSLYDRKSNGLGVITLKLSSATKTALGESGIVTLTNKGYTIA